MVLTFINEYAFIQQKGKRKCGVEQKLGLIHSSHERLGELFVLVFASCVLRPNSVSFLNIALKQIWGVVKSFQT